MSSSSSRLLEMIDATMAREKIPGKMRINENLPIDLKYAIAAVFAVKLALYTASLPRSVAQDLKEDFAALLALAIGHDGASSPGFLAAYDATSKDVIDVMRRRDAERGN